MSTFIQSFADAITRQEGFAPGTVAYNNNNPGNLWDGLASGKTSRIWPNIPIDARGFLVFPSLAAGRAALERDLTIKMNSGLTMEGAINMYAPASVDNNNTAAYISHMGEWLGVDVSQKLKDLAAGWGGAVSSAGTVESSPAGEDFAPVDGGVTAVPLVIAGSALLAAAALWLA